jgi:hypothetical protein
MSRWSIRRAAWSACSAGLLTLAVSGHAEEAASSVMPLDPGAAADARVRYQAGVTAYAAKHYADAIMLFLDANRIAPSAALSFDVARAYDKLGDTSNALAWYRDYLRRSTDPKDRADVAEQHVRPLERRLASTGVQQLTLLSTPGGARIAIDGNAVGSTPWTGDLPPGVHRVVASLEGFTDLTRNVTVSRDASLDVTLALAPTPAGEPSSPTPRPLLVAAVPPTHDDPRPANDSSHGSAVRTAGWLTLGVGGASLGTALVFEILRQRAESAAKKDATQIAYANDRSTMEHRQTDARIFAGAGAALAVTGVVLVLAGGGHADEPRADVAMDFGTNHVGARLSGTF